MRENATKYNDLIVSNFQERERFAVQEIESCEVEQEHLALLTTNGVQSLASINQGAELLENAYLGIVELLAEQKKELFSILKNRARQYNEMITWSIQERQKFIDEAE